jgi:hypothetical protein
VEEEQDEEKVGEDVEEEEVEEGVDEENNLVGPYFGK